MLGQVHFQFGPVKKGPFFVLSAWLDFICVKPCKMCYTNTAMQIHAKSQHCHASTCQITCDNNTLPWKVSHLSRCNSVTNIASCRHWLWVIVDIHGTGRRGTDLAMGELPADSSSWTCWFTADRFWTDWLTVDRSWTYWLSRSWTYWLTASHGK